MTSVTAGASSWGFSSPLEPRGLMLGMPRLSNADPFCFVFEPKLKQRDKGGERGVKTPNASFFTIDRPAFYIRHRRSFHRLTYHGQAASSVRLHRLLLWLPLQGPPAQGRHEEPCAQILRWFRNGLCERVKALSPPLCGKYQLPPPALRASRGLSTRMHAHHTYRGQGDHAPQRRRPSASLHGCSFES